MRKKMKKNLLTLMFVIAFICIGVSVASAKNSSSPGNSVAVSKRLSPAKTISNKIKALKAKCGVADPCAAQLADLVDANFFYEIQCADGGYLVGCAPRDEAYLLQCADRYELCLWYNGYSKNIDKTMARNKRQRSNV